jgi:general secretion pathway protein L
MAKSAVDLLNSDFGSLAESALAWWLGELRAMVPPRWRRIVTGTQERQVLELGRDGTVVMRSGEGDLTLLGQLVPEAPTDAIPARPAVTEASLSLPPERVLCRTLSLPLTRTRELPALLGFDLDRQTPLTLKQACFDFHVTSRDRRAGRMRVELVVAKREFVDRAIAGVTRWGFAVRSVSVAGLDWSPDLIRGRGDSGAARRRWMLLGGLCALALLLLTGLGLADLARLDGEADALQAAITASRAEADATTGLKKEIATLDDHVRFLPAARASRSATRLLEEIATILPDDCWTTSVSIEGDQIRLQGYAATATDLLSKIDASPLFRDAKFLAPVMKAPGAATERFDLGFTRRQAAP